MRRSPSTNDQKSALPVDFIKSVAPLDVSKLGSANNQADYCYGRRENAADDLTDRESIRARAGAQLNLQI
jgi:hypothetical protein